MDKIGRGWDNRGSHDANVNFRFWPSYTFPARAVGNKQGPAPTHFWSRLDNLPLDRVLVIEKLSGKPLPPHDFYEGQSMISPRSLSGGNPQSKYLDSGFLDFRHGGLSATNTIYTDGHGASAPRVAIEKAIYSNLGNDLWVDKLLR